MDVDEDEGIAGTSARTPARRARRQWQPQHSNYRASSRESTAGAWAEMDVHDSRTSPHSRERHSGSIARPPSGQTQEAVDSRYGVGAPRGHPFPSNPHGGFDLPPLNAAIGSSTEPMTPMGMGLGGAREGHFSGVGSMASYVRSGSASGFGGPPSRTHSPLAGSGLTTAGAAGTGGYVLPPPQGLAHGQSFSLSRRGHMSTAAAGSPHQHHLSSTGGISVPSVSELEHHYHQLGEERRRLQELLERTERMMLGVKQGLEEMQDGAQTQHPKPPAHSSESQSIPLRQRTPTQKTGSTSSQANVWHTAPLQPSARE